LSLPIRYDLYNGSSRSNLAVWEKRVYGDTKGRYERGRSVPGIPEQSRRLFLDASASRRDSRYEFHFSNNFFLTPFVPFGRFSSNSFLRGLSMFTICHNVHASYRRRCF